MRNVDHVSHPGSNTIADAIGFAVAQPYELPVDNAHRSCIGKSQLVTYKPAYHCAERPAESGAVDNAIPGAFSFPYYSTDEPTQRCAERSTESGAVCDAERPAESGAVDNAISSTFTFPYSSAESEAVCDKELRTISDGIWGAFRGRQQQS